MRLERRFKDWSHITGFILWFGIVVVELVSTAVDVGGAGAGGRP